MSKFLQVTRSLRIAAVSLLMSLPGSAWSEQVLIDTDFSVKADGAEFGISPNPTDMVELPLKSPTHIGVNPPSRITRGAEAVGKLPPPYARIQIESKDGLEGSSSGATISWNLKQLGLESGRYRLTYKIVPLTAGIPGGRMHVTLLGDDGKPMEGHPTIIPLQVAFTKDKILASHNARSEAYMENEIYEIEMTFDLDQKTWSASVNGASLLDARPFPENHIAAPSLRIGDVSFKNQGGLGDRAGSIWALTAVKLVKLD
ncbi:MAG: hypothetical protein WCH98_08610 [Verrucomicrobiota bacterium]